MTKMYIADNLQFIKSVVRVLPELSLRKLLALLIDLDD